MRIKPNWIELLVIVFIVVILLGLLLPVLFSPVRGLKRENRYPPQVSRRVLARGADEPASLVVLGQEIIGIQI